MIVRRTNVLAVVPAITPSVVIAVEEPLKCLEKRGVLSCTIRREWETKLSEIEGCDIAFFYRNVEPTALCLLRFARAIGKRLVYGLDDDFFTILPNTEVGRYYRRRMVQGTLRSFVEAADIVLVHSRLLARDIMPLNPNLAIWEDLHFDFSILDDPRLERDTHSGTVKIGYAGTPTHGPDFSPVIPAIKRIIKEYGEKVSFDFIGFQPEELRAYAQVTYAGWVSSYAEFIKLMCTRAWDIGLAPLSDTPPNRGKTNNKCREYGACLIPGIYSDMPLYRAFVRDRDTGILVPHTEDGWYKGMTTLIESRELRERIAVNAYEFAKSRYQLDKTADFYQRIFLDLCGEIDGVRPRWAVFRCLLGRALARGYTWLDMLYRLLGYDRDMVQLAAQFLRSYTPMTARLAVSSSLWIPQGLRRRHHV